MELIDVGYAPTLSYNLISAKVVKAGHKYSGDDPGLTVEKTYFAPLWGTVHLIRSQSSWSVSYTHLTLPTILLV